MIRRLQRSWDQAWRFVTRDLWFRDISSEAGLKGTALRGLRVLLLAARGYRKDRLTLHASALTNTTLLSLVPALAISFALMKGVGMEKNLLAWIAEHTQGMPENFRAFVDVYIVQSITAMNFAALGGVGLALLLFTTVQLLSSIEDSFNTVWAVTESRPLFRKFTDYISTVIIVPILILAAGTFRSSWVMEHLGVLAPVYQKLLKLSGFFTAMLAFTFVYKLIPNTRVRVGPALGAAFAASIAWLTWQKLYILFQVGVARWNPIYGTFAAIPIFIAWMYMSWVIVLVCAELSFALQNSDTFAAEQKSSEASPRARLRLALELLAATARAQRERGRPLDLAAFASAHAAPHRLVNRLSAELREAGILLPVADAEESFVLAWPPERVRVRDVVRALVDRGAGGAELGLKPAEPGVEAWLASMQAGLDTALGDASLADLSAAAAETGS